MEDKRVDILNFVHPANIVGLVRIRAANDNDQKVVIEKWKVQEGTSGYCSGDSTPASCSKNATKSNFQEGIGMPGSLLNTAHADLVTNAEPLSSSSESWPLVDLMNELYCHQVKVPNRRYQCHHCGVRAHHYIENCPKKYFLSNPNTPYQGEKRLVGEFLCPRCKKKWISWSCYTGKTQSCQKCRIQVDPKKMFSIQMAIERQMPGYELHFEKGLQIYASSMLKEFPY